MLIFLTDRRTFWFWELGSSSKQNPPVDDALYSRLLTACQYINIVRWNCLWIIRETLWEPLAHRKCFVVLFVQDTEQTLSSVDDDRKMYLQVRNLLWFCFLSLLFIWACDQSLLVWPTPQRNSHCGWRKGKLSTRSRKKLWVGLYQGILSGDFRHQTSRDNSLFTAPLFFNAREKKKKKRTRRKTGWVWGAS